MLRHVQLWAAAAGPLAAIATDAATAATINVKDSNRMCRSHVALLLQGQRSCHRGVSLQSERLRGLGCTSRVVGRFGLMRFHPFLDSIRRRARRVTVITRRGDCRYSLDFRKMVRPRGLEPPRVAPLAPQASASTNSATAACVGGTRARLARRRGCNSSVLARQGPAALEGEPKKGCEVLRRLGRTRQ